MFISLHVLTASGKNVAKSLLSFHCSRLFPGDLPAWVTVLQGQTLCKSQTCSFEGESGPSKPAPTPTGCHVFNLLDITKFEGTLFRGLSQLDTSLHVERVRMGCFVRAICWRHLALSCLFPAGQARDSTRAV